MLVNYMVRQGVGLSVAAALQVFAKHRPPGIYKPDYVDALFKYNHELPCGALLAAMLTALCWPRLCRGH